MSKFSRVQARLKCNIRRTAPVIFLVAIGSHCLLASAASGDTRPHYGFAARILLQHKISSLDPQVESEYPVDRDKIGTLVFESLTEIDGQGRLRPLLASSWQSQPGQRAWQFQLRLASFHDGTAVTSDNVIASLKAANPAWKMTEINRQAFLIETPAPVPHLPELLSLPKFAIVKRLPDNAFLGTGPYKIDQWQNGEHAVLSANDDYWGGRPYPDTVEVEMGVNLREQLLERNLGRSHAAPLTPEQARSLEQTNQNVLLSRPSELLAILFLQFDHDNVPGRRRPVNERLRGAISYSLNRQAISNVLLQRKATPAASLLPQWLNGYEFLFGDNVNAEQASRLRAQAGGVSPVSLAYDFSDPLAKMVAERIAVDAREAGIPIQPYADTHINTKAARKTSNADAVLLRIALPELDPAAALAGMADQLDLTPEVLTAILSAGRADELLAAEHKALEDYRIIPIAHLEQALWLNNTVHNWQQLPDGAWNLDQMWVEK